MKEVNDSVLDSTNDLIKAFGKEEDFIEHFIKSSFFFSLDQVKKRAKEINTIVENGEKLPVRFSQKSAKYFTYDHKLRKLNSRTTKKSIIELIDEDNFVCKSNNIQVKLDSTGNKTLVDIIYVNTKRKVSSGPLSNMFNYTISHVWKGQTYDPMYFSSLWNVILVPNYLNYLMDKPSTQHPINYKIQEIIKAICLALYNPKGLHKEYVDFEVIENEYLSYAKKAIDSKWIKYLTVIPTSKNESEKIEDDNTYSNNNNAKFKNKDFIFNNLRLLNENEIPSFVIDILSNKKKMQRVI